MEIRKKQGPALPSGLSFLGVREVRNAEIVASLVRPAPEMRSRASGCLGVPEAQLTDEVLRRLVFLGSKGSVAPQKVADLSRQHRLGWNDAQRASIAGSLPSLGRAVCLNVLTAEDQMRLGFLEAEIFRAPIETWLPLYLQLRRHDVLQPLWLNHAPVLLGRVLAQPSFFGTLPPLQQKAVHDLAILFGIEDRLRQQGVDPDSFSYGQGNVLTVSTDRHRKPCRGMPVSESWVWSRLTAGDFQKIQADPATRVQTHRASVIVLCAGNGLSFLEHAAQFDQSRVLLLDANAANVARLARTLDWVLDRNEYTTWVADVRTSFNGIQVAEESADTAMMLGTSDHAMTEDDVAQILASAFVQLKPGGKLVVESDTLNRVTNVAGSIQLRGRRPFTVKELSPSLAVLTRTAP